MPKSQELRAELDKANIELEALLNEQDNGSLPADKAERLNALVDECEQLIQKVEFAQKVENMRQEINELNEPALRAPVQPVINNSLSPNQPAALPTMQPAKPQQLRISMPMHHGSLLVFNRGPNDVHSAYKIGRFFDAMFNRNIESLRWCRENGITYKGQHLEGVNETGGILVPQEMSDRIIETRDMYGVFRANTYIEPMGSDSKTVPRRKGGYVAHHVGEAKSTPLDESKLFDQVNLTAKKVSVFTSMSDEIEADAMANFGDQITQAAAEALALREDTDGFLGDADSVSGGIHGLFKKILDGNYVGAVPAAAGHNTFESIDADDLHKLMGTLPEVARRRGGNQWFMSGYAYENVVGRISMAGGGNTISSVAEGWMPRFMGAPVQESAVLPGLGDLSGVGMLAYGNLRQSSTMGSRLGITVKRSEHALFDTDEIALKFQQRYDIVNHDLGDDVRAGMIVVLIGSS